MKQIDYYIEKANRIAMSGHIRPDGDCIGSTLALYNYIKENYPEKEIFLPLDEILDSFRFLKSSDEIDHTFPEKEAFDLFVALDCADSSRLEPSEKYLKEAKYTLCIDHHISNEGFADENLIVPDASSTCEVLYDLLDPEKVSEEVAECLYVGIVHDSGVFQYSCTSENTFRVAGRLISKGFDFTKIIDDTFNMKSYDQNRITGKVLEESKLYLEGKVVSGSVSKADMEKYHVTAKHLDGIVSQLRYTRGIEAAVFGYPLDENTYKISFRSNGLDVAKVAQSFGGGGHVRAAGCSIEGKNWEEVLAKILPELEKII
jgi:bifunctional oligoribonuclease and PAP phosphatase NrnA